MPPRDSRTVADVRREKKPRTRIDRELSPPAQPGTVAAVKRQDTRDTGQARSRDRRAELDRDVDDLIFGKIDSKEASRRFAGLSEVEKRYVVRRSSDRSKTVQAENARQMLRDTEKAAGFLIGPDLAKAVVPGGDKPGKGGLAIDAALLAPGTLIRGARAGVAAVRAVDGARAVEKAAPPVRTFKTGDLAVEVPAARSRTGRAIERGIDKARPVLAKTKLVKTEDARAGLEVRRRGELAAKMETAPASALERVGRKLNPAEQVALLVLAEEAPTAQRIALHSGRAAQTSSRTERLYHGIHTRLAGKAAKYLDESGDVPRLAENAPNHLKEAWRLLETTGAAREAIYKTLGRLTEEGIGKRLGAPARVYATGKPLAKEAAPPTPGQMSLTDELGDAAPLSNPGRVYVGKQRGIPGMTVRGIADVAKSVPRMFSAGSKRAVAGGGKDDALDHSFTGESILSGRFSTDTTGTVAKGLRTASRLSGAARMRPELLQAAHPAAQAADDLAIREDAFLGKRLPDQLRKLWDEMEAVRAGEQGGRALGRVEELEDQISAALRNELFSGDSPAAGKTIEGIKWLSRDFAEGAGLMEVPEATRLVTRGWSGLARAGAKTPGVLLDVVNDLAKASVLGITFPAYHGVQLTQNAIMLTMGQGPLALAKIPRAWMLSRELLPEHLAKVDSLMQLDKLYQARQGKLITKKITDPLAKFATVVADLGPRRTAFLNEAAREGFANGAALRNLLDDPANFDKLKLVADRANTVMGDFDKLSNVERQYISRVFWFYPWTHVAFRYTARFPLDHPVQTAAVIEGDRRLQERADEQLGERPFYARNYQKIGEHEDGTPRIVNTGPLTAFTTPLEFTQAAYAFATGRKDLPQLGDRLTPALFGLGEAFFGTQYTDERGLPAFAKSFGDIPVRRRVGEILKTDEQRQEDKTELLRPRTRAEAIMQLAAGPLAPTGYNRDIGEQRAEALQEERENAGRSPVERATRKVFEEREKVFLEAKRLMPGALENGRLPVPLRQAFNKKAQRFSAYAAADLKHGDRNYQRKAFEIDLTLFKRWGVATDADIREAMLWSKTADDDAIEKLRRRWSDQGGPFHIAYLGSVGHARRALEELGANLDD